MSYRIVIDAFPAENRKIKSPMNYYFEKIEQLVHAVVLKKESVPLSEPAEIKSTLELIMHEKEQIRTNIIQYAFETPEQKMMELFIDKQQSILTRLLNEIFNVQKNNHETSGEKILINTLFKELNDLLQFLRMHYANFFNLKGSIPSFERNSLLQEIAPPLEKIIQRLKIYLPEKIVSQFEDPLKLFLSGEHISYKESGYIRAVIQELHTVAFNPDIDNLLQNFKMFLIAVNFNTPEIGKYFTSEWEEELSKEDSIQEKIRLLKFNSKEIRQLGEKKGWSLYPDEASLKELVLTWLGEEINYYETGQAALSPIQHDPESDAKIHTSMSVPQLALLFRLLKADKQITNENQSEFLKIVANSFTTIKKENFSYGHLHGKYYKIEAHTRRTVYDMLMRLLHLSRKVGLDEKV